MKKRLFPSFILIFAFFMLVILVVILFVVRNTTTSTGNGLDETGGVVEFPAMETSFANPVSKPTISPHRELESLIFWGEKLYSLHEIEEYPVYSADEHMLYGVIEESTSRYEEPTTNLMTNDDILVGNKVYQFVNEMYSDALSVDVEGKTWIYIPYVATPEAQKIYFFQNEQDLIYLVIKSMEEYGYYQTDKENHSLLQFSSIPDEFKFLGVFEKTLDASLLRCSISQIWYCEEPCRLLVLNQEQMDNPVPINKLTYIDRLRSQISPEYAWVTSQAHYVGYLDNYGVNAELYSADDISNGYGDFIQEIINIC